MVDATSLIPANQMPQLRKLVRDGLQTELDLVTPPVYVTFKRQDTTTLKFEPVDGTAHHVIVRYANNQAWGDANGLASQNSTVVIGTLDGFAPMDVEISDRFTLPSGKTAIVTTPEPRDEFGVVTLTFRVDQGAN